MAFYLAKQVKSTDLGVKNPLVGEFFQSLEDNVQHADLLLEQTSSFTEPALARGAFGEASIVDCIRQAVDHCRTGDASVAFDLKADPCSVVIEPSSIVVALRALLENAIEAIEPGRAAGQVTISGRVRRDRYVIEVVDPGPGMGTPAEALTPFFSTKPGHLKEAPGRARPVPLQIAEAPRIGAKRDRATGAQDVGKSSRTSREAARNGSGVG